MRRYILIAAIFMLGMLAGRFTGPSSQDMRSEISREFQQRYAKHIVSEREEIPSNPAINEERLKSPKVNASDRASEQEVASMIEVNEDLSSFMDSDETPYLLKLALGNFVEDYESYQLGNIDEEQYLVELYSSTYKHLYNLMEMFSDEQLPPPKFCAGSKCMVIDDPLKDSEDLIADFRDFTQSQDESKTVAFQFGFDDETRVYQEVYLDKETKELNMREMRDGKPVSSVITYQEIEEVSSEDNGDSSRPSH